MKPLIGLLLAFIVTPAIAQDLFTPAQRSEIQRMIEADRAQVRAQVIAEIERNGGSLAAAQAPPGTSGAGGSTETVSQAPNASQPGPALERTAYKGPIGVEPADRVLRDAGSSYELAFDQDKTQASVVVGRTIDTETRSRGGELARALTRTWSFKATAPIDDEDNRRANFATLDGLSKGLGLGYTYAWHVTDTRFLRGLVNDPDWKELCKLSQQDAESDCSYGEMIDASTEDNDLAKKLAEFRRDNFGWAKTLAFTLETARSDFKYLTPTLEKQTDTEMGWGLGVSAAFIPPSRRALYGVGIDFQRVYEAKRSTILCPAPSGAGTVQCVQGPLGPPSRTYKRLLWGEVRSAALGIPYSLRVTHDFESDEYGADLPVYFFRSTDGPYTAGLRFGWTTTDKFDAGLFVSAPFSLFH